LAAKADIPTPVRATPDVIIKGESTPTDRMNVFVRFSEIQFVRLAVQNPWIYSNVKIIGQIVAEGDLRVETRIPNSPEKWEGVLDHPFETIIEGRPNPYMSQYYVWLYQTIWYLMKGEAYWLLIKNDLGEIVEVYPLPASRVLPIPGKEEMFSGFAYSPVLGERPVVFLPEDIIYHRLPNIFQYFRGWSPLNAYLLSLQTDREAAEFDLRDYEHGLELKQIISFRPELDDTEFLTAIQDLVDGQEDGLRFMGIRGGDLDVKNITQRRAESNGDIREKMASMAGRIIGVFDGFWDKSSNRASSERAEQNTISYGAWPVMKMFSEDITAQAVIPAYGEDFRVVFDDIRPRNIELDIQEENHNWSAMTWDQVQITQGRDPHPDPDIGGAPFTAASKIAETKVSQNNAITGQDTLDNLLEQENSPAENGSETSSSDEETDQKVNILLNGHNPNLELKSLDYKKWRTVSLRNMAKGKRPESYTFESKYIPLPEIETIRKLLTVCETVGDVKNLFKQTGEPFIPEGSIGYTPVDPPIIEIAEFAEEESELFSNEFDGLVPDLATILESEDIEETVNE